MQEAILGVVFVLASSAAVLLLAKNPHGGEHLKDLLVGQILWVNPSQLPLEALFYGVILALWFGLRERLGRVGFYVIFACAVTISVQLVGLYLVFVTLVVPALATWYSRARRLLKGYLIGALGYVIGLAASLAADLPSGPMIVCAIAGLGLLVLVVSPRSPNLDGSAKFFGEAGPAKAIPAGHRPQAAAGLHTSIVARPSACRR